MNPSLPASPRIRQLPAALIAIVALAAVAITGVATESASAAKFKQPTCGKLKKKRDKKQCKANALVYTQVKDSHFVGYRSDGIYIDTFYCASGRTQDGTPPYSQIFKLGWKVNFARVKSAKKFEAIVEAKIPGGTFVQAVKRNGSQWQVGYESGDRGQAYGDVEKTSAKSECSKL